MPRLIAALADRTIAAIAGKSTTTAIETPADRIGGRLGFRTPIHSARSALYFWPLENWDAPFPDPSKAKLDGRNPLLPPDCGLTPGSRYNECV